MVMIYLLKNRWLDEKVVNIGHKGKDRSLGTES